MTTLNDIQRYYDVINSSLFMTTGKLDYERITDAIIALANAVHSYDPDDKFELYEVWDIGEGGESTVSELIVGAYWHYSEWHAGQWSKGYAALCALGQVFNPGMTSTEPENYAYLALNDMAA
jgi:hypothetical protein